MPLIKIEQFSDGSEIGIWEITEDSTSLESMAVLSVEEKSLLATFRNETRRRHWLSYRLIIGHMLGHGKASVHYLESGKPFIKNLEGHISVTHSGSYSAVIYNAKCRVGIDVEQIKPRIENVAGRFLCEKELKVIAPKQRLEHLVSLWAAKEALFKLWGKEEVDFRDHLFVEAFAPQANHSAIGYVRHNGSEGRFTLHFSRVSDYVLVWTSETTVLTQSS
jgi:4'-phosphopantetheinyl transferase